MIISKLMVQLVTLVYKESSAIIVMNDVKSTRFRTKGGIRQGCPLSPYLFIIVLELMAIEMRQDTAMTGVTPPHTTQTITSFSRINNQPDNKDDRLSMFADDSSTITTRESEVKAARENNHLYKKASTSKLHEG